MVNDEHVRRGSGLVSSSNLAGCVQQNRVVNVILFGPPANAVGFGLTENFYVNIIKEGLRELGLPVGAWLNRFKAAIYQKESPHSDFVVSWKEKGKATREERFVLGELAQKIARISPGQKIAYITDVVATPENSRKIIAIAKEANHLFIEAAFLDSDKDMALKKYHLTAREAGVLAGKAGVKSLQLFHFSPRYKHRADDLEREAKEAYLRMLMGPDES